MLITLQNVKTLCEGLQSDEDKKLINLINSSDAVQWEQLLEYLNRDTVLKKIPNDGDYLTISSRLVAVIKTWIDNNIPKKRRRGAPEAPDAASAAVPAAASISTYVETAAATPSTVMPGVSLSASAAVEEATHDETAKRKKKAVVDKTTAAHAPKAPKAPKAPNATKAPKAPRAPKAAKATTERGEADVEVVRSGPRLVGHPPRSSIRKSPFIWRENDQNSTLEHHILVAVTEDPTEGMCNRLLDLIGRSRIKNNVRKHMQECVVLPHTFHRYMHSGTDGMQLVCRFAEALQTPVHPTEETVVMALLMAVGRRIAHVAPLASVTNVQIHSYHETLGRYVDACAWDATAPEFAIEADGLQVCQEAWHTPVRGEVVLWALYDDHWADISSDDPQNHFWKVDHATYKVARDFWTHRAVPGGGGSGAGGEAQLRVCWTGVDDETCDLFVTPPRRWFDCLEGVALRDLDDGSKPNGALPTVRIVMVRCWSADSGRPRRLGADCCLPYAIVTVAPGAWLRAAKGGCATQFNDLVLSMRRTAGLAEAVHDTMLHAMHSAVRPERAFPKRLLCDDYGGVYTACLRDSLVQNRGVDLSIRSCHRIPRAESARSTKRYLSFVCVEIAMEESQLSGVEEWFLRLFHGPPALREALLNHSQAAWCASEKVTYHSPWAGDVVGHVARHQLHHTLVENPEQDAVVFVVSTTTEVSRPAKKTVDALQPDMILEAVLCTTLHTPLTDMPVVF